MAAALRVMGLCDKACFFNHHWVLQRAVWSSLVGSGVLLPVLTFAPKRTVVIGGDESIERRRGDHIQTKGTLHGRNPMRSGHLHFVKASGRRWVGLMLLVPALSAGLVPALQLMTVLAASERYCKGKARLAKRADRLAFYL